MASGDCFLTTDVLKYMYDIKKITKNKTKTNVISTCFFFFNMLICVSDLQI